MNGDGEGGRQKKLSRKNCGKSMEKNVEGKSKSRKWSDRTEDKEGKKDIGVKRKRKETDKQADIERLKT